MVSVARQHTEGRGFEQRLRKEKLESLGKHKRLSANKVEIIGSGC